MDEHVLATVVMLNEAEAFCRVEPLHRADSHRPLVAGLQSSVPPPPARRKNFFQRLGGGNIDRESGGSEIEAASRLVPASPSPDSPNRNPLYPATAEKSLRPRPSASARANALAAPETM